jgi:polar amino acid transport system permease protein
MTFDFDYAAHILPILLRGTVITLLATTGGMALALVGGLGLAVARLSPLGALRVMSGAYVDFVRGTPLLIQLFFLFYVLPKFGIALPPLMTGILALGLNYSAYTAEVYRAGILAVPTGQWEAAIAINLSSSRTWTRIILPQAIPPMIPALGNYALGMYKETPLLVTITVQELLGAALAQASNSFRFLEPLTLVGVIFLAISYPAALVVRRLERRFGQFSEVPIHHG